MKYKLAAVLILSGLLLASCQLGPQKPKTEEVYTVCLSLILNQRTLKGVGFTGGPAVLPSMEWWYTWGVRCEADKKFVPMIRGRPQMAYLQEAVACALAHDGWLMGFNEPDMPEPYGNDIPPAEAAELWHQIELAAADVRLLSPAPSQGDPTWLWRMVNEYEQKYGHKPRFDAIGVHWYNWEHPGTAQPAKDYLVAIHNQAMFYGYDVPIWLTEFAGHVSRPDPSGGHARLMNELIPWMEAQPWIARYAWFASLVKEQEPWCIGCQYCSLTNQNGSLTVIGELYVSK